MRRVVSGEVAVSHVGVGMCQPEPMVDFDAERYLRVLGEQELADRDGASLWAGPIDHAAAALVAVGAIAAEDARAVLAEFGCEPPADANAGRGWVAGRGRRVVALNTDVRLLSGILRLGYGLLGDEETAIAASYGADPGHTGIYHDWIRVPSGWPSGLQPPLLTDDRGRATALTFHGSGNDDRWRATLRAESPIATDTAWIDLCGARIACVDDGPAVRVAIEPVCDVESAHAHLWRRLARSHPGFEFDREPPQATIDALIASGALAVNDPC